MIIEVVSEGTLLASGLRQRSPLHMSSESQNPCGCWEGFWDKHTAQLVLRPVQQPQETTVKDKLKGQQWGSLKAGSP